MAVSSLQALPADLFHVLAAELSDRLDFSTLYNCIVSSKQLANSGAITALYRISHYAPIKGGGGEALPFLEQELNVQRWSIFWRSVTLSALGKTQYAYCRHLKFLDLRDLGHLLEDDKFRGKIAKNFFAGDLAKFHFVQQTPGKGRAIRLDTKKITTAIGDEITQRAPQLEELTEPTNSPIFSTTLLTWAPRLSHLKSLDFFDGKALADETIRNLLHAHCPNLSSLCLYNAANEDADHHLAMFIGGMQGNSLVHFENISNCGIGTQTCLALNNHGQSLTSLKLGLTEDGVQALGLLQGCIAIKTLAIESFTTSLDLKTTQNDVYLGIIAWLKDCTALQDVSLTGFVSAPDLLLPVLLNKDTHLETLQINATERSMYAVKDHHDFHQALVQQAGLRSLLLRADPDPGMRDDTANLINSFCSLTDLRVLRLPRISDWFSDEHIMMLADYLQNLEDIYIGGYGISDAVLLHLSHLKNLKVVAFSGITSFTEDGLLSFIERLGAGNEGLYFTIDNADPDTGMSQESQDLVRDAMAAKVNGRFEYQLLRDPNVPEFAGDSDDSD